MKIILEENEIQEALETYVSATCVIPEGKTVEVDFGGSATKGYEATLTFSDETASKPKTPRKRAVKKTEPKLVETETKDADPTPVGEPEEAGEDPAVSPEPDTAQEEETTAPAETPVAERPKPKDGGIFNFKKPAAG